MKTERKTHRDEDFEIGTLQNSYGSKSSINSMTRLVNNQVLKVPIGTYLTVTQLTLQLFVLKVRNRNACNSWNKINGKL
jgi:hypothetical protein